MENLKESWDIGKEDSLCEHCRMDGRACEHMRADGRKCEHLRADGR